MSNTKELQILQITKKNALSAYNKADKNGKDLLSELFGKQIFSQDIRDRVKTFEDACEIVGVDPNDEKFHIGDADDIAYQKLKVICKALNEDWEADWSNANEYKYEPYFRYTSGVGFSYGGCAAWNTSATVCSRLCFKSSDLAIYAGQQFQSIYNDLLS